MAGSALRKAIRSFSLIRALPIYALTASILASQACSESTAPPPRPAAGPASKMRPAATSEVSWKAGELVPAYFLPGVLVTDTNGTPVPGITVRFALTSGGGSLSGETSVTDKNGLAVSPQWRFGTAAGEKNQGVTASVDGLELAGEPVAFSYSTVGTVASSISFLGSDSLFVRPGRPLMGSNMVYAKDQYGNPATGTITARILEGGGSLTSATSVTLGVPVPGTAIAPGWKIGPNTGVNRISLTADGTSLAPIIVTAIAATTLPTPFNIDVRFLYEPSAEEREAWADAVFRIRQTITAALPEHRVQANAGVCEPNTPAIDTVTTGIVVFANVDKSMSGGAHQHSCLYTTSPTGSRIPSMSQISGATSAMLTVGTIVHELEHALGTCSSSLYNQKITPGGPSGYLYTGSNGILALSKVTGEKFATGVPMKDFCHLAPEAALNDFSSSSFGSLSQDITTIMLGIFQDTGFQVDMRKAAKPVPSQ